MAQDQQPPISVLRKSGSFVSLRQLQQQKSSENGNNRFDVSGLPETDRKTKVTIINTNNLPKYSTERFYMLSEIQLKSHSIIFLKDLLLGGDGDGDGDAGEDTDEMTASSTDSAERGDRAEVLINRNNNEFTEQNNAATIGREAERTPVNLPPYIVLYLFWRPDSEQYIDPALYAKHVIKEAVDQIISLHKSSDKYDEANPSASPPPPIYLSVDRLVVVDPSISDDERAIAKFKQEQIDIAEELIRVVANAVDPEINLRLHIEGMSVGLSSDFRAAPGLETCMDAIVVGDAERRHYPKPKHAQNSMTVIRNGREFDPSRSCIGIVTEYPDDLTGSDPSGETDAVQNLTLHARSVGNWSGRGNILNFAARSQKRWREIWDFSTATKNSNGYDLKRLGNSYTGILSKRRNRGESSKYLPSEHIRQNVDHSADLMVLGFFAFLLAIGWKLYSEEISALILMILKIVGGLLEKFH